MFKSLRALLSVSTLEITTPVTGFAVAHQLTFLEDIFPPNGPNNT